MGSGRDDGEPIEELEEEAAAHNPDPTTRREAFELELMEEGRSAEGAEVDDVDEVEADDDGDADRGGDGDDDEDAATGGG